MSYKPLSTKVDKEPFFFLRIINKSEGHDLFTKLLRLPVASLSVIFFLELIHDMGVEVSKYSLISGKLSSYFRAVQDSRSKII